MACPMNADFEAGCLRLRGLPFTATQLQVVDWFEGYNVMDVLITKADGKPNGQAFVLLPKAEALKAQVELNNKYMGKRFIEVFNSTIADMETARRMCAEQQKASGSSNGGQRSKPSTNSVHIIRLRGLPFSATPADIKAFLAPVELPDGINSIQMVRHPDLRPTGEAYVHLRTEAEVMQALNKHKQMMGKRYIEVFMSCLAELQQSMTPPHPMYHQQLDAGLSQSSGGAGRDVPQVSMFGLQAVPTGGPAARAAWLQRQQQLLLFQQQMQLQAAAQQKVLATLQHQFQNQVTNLRVHAQLQAQAQALPAMLQRMQLSDPSNIAQQPQPDALGATGLAALKAPKQQHTLMLNDLSMAMASLPLVAASLQPGGTPFAPSMATSGSGAAISSLSSDLATCSLSGYNTGSGLSATAGGLACTAAAAATAICSPSPLDVQYVPFFTAPMAAQVLQDVQGSHPRGLQLVSPGCQTVLSNLTSVSSAQQQPALGVDLLSNSASAVDSSALAAANMGGAALAPLATSTGFCSDVMLQGLSGSSLSGMLPTAYLGLQGSSQHNDSRGGY